MQSRGRIDRSSYITNDQSVSVAFNFGVDVVPLNFELSQSLPLWRHLKLLFSTCQSEFVCCCLTSPLPHSYMFARRWCLASLASLYKFWSICLCIYSFHRRHKHQCGVKNKFGVLNNNNIQTLPNDRYTRKPMKNFLKILVSSAPNREQKLQNTIFSRKMLVFLLKFFICSYLTAVECTIGKNSLNWRQWHIIC